MLVLPDLSRLSLRDTEPTDARTKASVKRERDRPYDAEEQWLILRHAIVVAWMLKRVTANQVDLEVDLDRSLAAPDRRLPDDAVFDIMHEVYAAPQPQPYKPTYNDNLNHLDLDEAVGYYDAKVRGSPVAMESEYRRQVGKIKEYLVNTYAMQIRSGVPHIQYQGVMNSVMLELVRRFPQTKWPVLMRPARAGPNERRIALSKSTPVEFVGQ